MSDNQDTSLLSSLASLLSGQQVNSEATIAGLSLICEHFFCTDALVYDMDQHATLHLMEHLGDMAHPHAFRPDRLYPTLHAQLSHTSSFHLVRGDSLFPDGDHLLDLFSVDRLVIAPVVGEHFRIHGLIILLDAHGQLPCDDISSTLLSTALSLLVHYVGIRMYQKRTSFIQTSLESVLDNTGIDIYVNDFDTHDILYVNRSMAAPYGGKDAFKDKKCWQVLFPGQSGPCQFCPQKKLTDENGVPTKTYTWDYERPFDGSWFRVFSSAFRWVDGRLAHVVSSADITDNKRNEKLIEYMAHYDDLTKLPNRRMLVRDCEQYIGGDANATLGYVLFFDIDGFKAVNDQFGHDAGDELLIQLGAFFASIPMLKNAIYRNGGDEFVAILGGQDVTKTHIQNLGSFIHRRFQSPWQLKKGRIYCNTSIGVACYPEDGTTAEALLLKSDQAMYHAKKQGAGGICFAFELG